MNKSKTKYVGKNVLRFEDERLLNGNGQYTACLLYTSDAADE